MSSRRSCVTGCGVTGRRARSQPELRRRRRYHCGAVRSMGQPSPAVSAASTVSMSQPGKAAATSAPDTPRRRQGRDIADDIANPRAAAAPRSFDRRRDEVESYRVPAAPGEFGGGLAAPADHLPTIGAARWFSAVRPTLGDRRGGARRRRGGSSLRAGGTDDHQACDCGTTARGFGGPGRGSGRT